MNNVAVVYRSMTGHSKKIAKAIASEFFVEALDIKSKPELSNVDLLFLIGAIYGGKSANETIEFVKALNTSLVKKAVLITSSTSNKTGHDEVRQILTDSKIEVAGECRLTGNFLFLKIGHPNKKEIDGAIEFCKKIAEESNG